MSIFRIFVAGSVELKREREICRSICNSLQNRWGTINTYTFEDFSEVIQQGAHQDLYNNYIENDADLVIFIFSEKVGSITISEFEHAYQAFMQNNRPRILPYFQRGDSEEIIKLKNKFSEIRQYYQEYSSIEELENKIEKQLNKYLETYRRSAFEIKIKKMLIFACIWFVLSFIGGIGMYIYDLNMSIYDKMKLVSNYVEEGPNHELIYRFPDETLVYNIETEYLEIKPYRYSFSTTDISMSKVKDVSLGTTISFLFTRMSKSNVLKNSNGNKIVLAIAGIMGVGVGCVIEQMLYPPQYSKSVREYLSSRDEWKKIAQLKRAAYHREITDLELYNF